MIVVSKDELTDKWWITYNVEKTVVHYGKTEAPQQTETGLPLFQVFDDEASWLSVLDLEFNIIPE
jgi:hypothetical protein